MTVPKSVTYIGTLAFADCEKLKEVRILGNPEISDNAFDDDSIIRYGK